MTSPCVRFDYCNAPLCPLDNLASHHHVKEGTRGEGLRGLPGDRFLVLLPMGRCPTTISASCTVTIKVQHGIGIAPREYTAMKTYIPMSHTVELLWSLEKVGRQLGGVSARTIRRLIARGALPVVRVGRCIRVPVTGVHEYIARMTTPAHNLPRAEPGVREEFTCHTVAKTVPFGGRPTPIQAARELDDLLKQPTVRKQRRSKQKVRSTPIGNPSVQGHG